MPENLNRRSEEFLDEFILIEDEPLRKGEEGTEVNPRLEQVRAAVVLTKEAVRAASITALELATESAHFMGVVSRGGELVNPFEHIQAPVWEEDNVPQKMVDAAYAYCEELTRREAGNFYHSFKYLPEEQRKSICAYYAFCRRADDIADGDYVDIFPGALGPTIRRQSPTEENWRNWRQPNPSLSEQNLKISWLNCSSSGRNSRPHTTACPAQTRFSWH